MIAPVFGHGFLIERFDTKSYDYIMATLKRQKNEIIETLQQAKEVQTAADFGIDIPLLIDNIKRTPAERIRRHQIALNTADKLRKAKLP